MKSLKVLYTIHKHKIYIILKSTLRNDFFVYMLILLFFYFLIEVYAYVCKINETSDLLLKIVFDSGIIYEFGMKCNLYKLFV